MTIAIACETCGCQYKLKDELAGRKVKCKQCQAIFVVPKPPPGPVAVATTGHGDPVYKYTDETRPKKFEIAFGDSENIERITEHIEQYVGPVKSVYHELLSDVVHVDVHQVFPSKQRPYHTLITSGMSDRPMNAPEQVAECQYAELMLSLPAEWPVDKIDPKDRRHYWPIYLLKMLARFPHQYNTWLWWGHTMPNGDPPEPYADNTKLCCALLLSPLRVDEGFNQLFISPEKTIHFFSIVPIYQEEMVIKLDQGTEALLPGFDKHGVTELLDVKRPNVCKKKGWW